MNGQGEAGRSARSSSLGAKPLRLLRRARDHLVKGETPLTDRRTRSISAAPQVHARGPPRLPASL